MTERKRRDIAYGSFFALGLVALWARVNAYEGWGDSPDALAMLMMMLVIMPFGIPALIALILGVWFTFSCRRWDPVLVSLALVPFAILPIVWNSFQYEAILFVAILLVVYGGFCIVASILWMRHFPKRMYRK